MVTPGCPVVSMAPLQLSSVAASKHCAASLNPSAKARAVLLYCKAPAALRWPHWAFAVRMLLCCSGGLAACWRNLTCPFTGSMQLPSDGEGHAGHWPCQAAACAVLCRCRCLAWEHQLGLLQLR